MKKRFKLLIGTIISLVILYFLLKGISFDMFSVFVSKITLPAFILAFISYTIMNVVRAARIKIIFQEIKFSTLMNISFTHNMINNILPMRTGEISYLYMIKKEKAISHAFSSLLVIRIFDLVALFSVFAISLLFVEMSETLAIIFKYSAMFVFAILLVLLIFRHINILKFKLIKDIRKQVREYKKRKIIIILITSIIIWILSFLFYYILVQTMNIELSFFQVIIASVFIVLSTILPINGIAGFGTTEATWTIGLLMFGIDKNTAIISGLIIHFARIISFTVIGVYGLIMRIYYQK